MRCITPRVISDVIARCVDNRTINSGSISKIITYDE